jgi:hypothetical protein
MASIAHYMDDLAAPDRLARDMSIHETMSRGYIRHGGSAWPYYLLMRFHAPALIRDPGGEVTKVAGRTIFWKPFSNRCCDRP